MPAKVVLAGVLLLPVVIAAPQLAGAQGQAAAVSAHDFYFEAPDGSRTPAAVTIAAGGSVSFGYAAGFSRHDVHFVNGPAAPSCAGTTPAAQAAFDSAGSNATPQGPGWSGSCTFTAPGDYGFQCTLHPSLMYGTVHVAATGSGSTSGTAPESGSAPTTAPVVGGLAVASLQRGSTVTGAVTLNVAGARLVVDLYAARSLLAVAHSVRVGQTAASGLPAGRYRFSVALNATARSALRRHRRLALKLKLSITAGSQPGMLLTRRVTLRA
jgi:plastocyanin